MTEIMLRWHTQPVTWEARIVPLVPTGSHGAADGTNNADFPRGAHP